MECGGCCHWQPAVERGSDERVATPPNFNFNWKPWTRSLLIRHSQIAGGNRAAVELVCSSSRKLQDARQTDYHRFPQQQLLSGRCAQNTFFFCRINRNSPTSLSRTTLGCSLTTSTCNTHHRNSISHCMHPIAITDRYEACQRHISTRFDFPIVTLRSFLPLSPHPQFVFIQDGRPDGCVTLSPARPDSEPSADAF